MSTHPPSTTKEDPTLENMPGLPHQAIAKLLQDFKNEVFMRLDQFEIILETKTQESQVKISTIEEELPDKIINSIEDIARLTWMRRKKWLRKIITNIPGAIIVVLYNWIVTM